MKLLKNTHIHTETHTSTVQVSLLFEVPCADEKEHGECSILLERKLYNKIFSKTGKLDRISTVRDNYTNFNYVVQSLLY